MSIDKKVEQIEMSEIDKKIVALPEEKQINFHERLYEVMQDEIWLLVLHPNEHFDFFNPDRQKQRIKETLYQEEYAKYAPENSSS